MIVLDASAAVELVLATPAGAAVAARLRGETLHVPAHFDVEAAGAVRRAVIRGLISDYEGLVASADLRILPVRRWSTIALIARAYELRVSHSVADGVYVAMAEGLGSPLVTCDGPLARSHGHHADIQLIVETS